ncbi:MAG TPA: hypothetical protein EYF96_03980 [Nitrospinaceae bacterium]|nr:hypothetical protein [Nitrospinaceae bacterium]
MLSHKFRTHIWAKRKQNGKDHAHFLMNSTTAQRSFIHELASQQMGHPPSRLWGVPIPTEFHQPADHKTLSFVRNAAKHSSHEFGRLISSHKTGSGWVGALSDFVGDAAKTSAKYLGKVGKFMGEHGEAIKNGVSIGKDLFQTGTQIAQLAGWMHQDTKSNLDAMASAIDKHAQGDHYKPKKPTNPKKGGGFRVLI